MIRVPLSTEVALSRRSGNQPLAWTVFSATKPNRPPNPEDDSGGGARSSRTCVQKSGISPFTTRS